MLHLMHDRDVSGPLIERLREPLEEATKSRHGFCEAYLYRVGGRTEEFVLRLSTAHAVVPILLQPRDLEPNRVLALVKNALTRADV